MRRVINYRLITALIVGFLAALTTTSCQLASKELEASMLPTPNPVRKNRITQEFRAQPATLAAIKRRDKLRVLTTNHAMAYFVAGGAQFGFDYSLAVALADYLEVELEVIVPPSTSAAYAWLQDGGGDILIGPHPKGHPLPKPLRRTAPYKLTTTVIVKHKRSGDIRRVEDLAGRSIHAIRKTAQAYELEKFVALHAAEGVRMASVSAQYSEDQLVDLLESGDIELIALEGHFATTAIRSIYKDLEVVHRLTEPKPASWVVGGRDKKLRMKINSFLSRHYRLKSRKLQRGSNFYNILHRFYFNSSRSPRWPQQKEPYEEKFATISPYDELVKQVASEYGLDWRLVLAMIYVESHFDPRAKSHRGARGLMQLLPSTFASLGYKNIFDIEENVRAGSAYLKYLLRYVRHKGFASEEQVRFVLASYNAGIGHFADARWLAAELGFATDRWEGGIKEGFRRLQEKRYYKRVKHGYCHAKETLAYVDKVMEQYLLYKKMAAI